MGACAGGSDPRGLEALATASGAGSAREVIGPAELSAGVQRLGSEVSLVYPTGVVLVAVLKGALWFVADLLRALSVPCEVDFLAISSYAPGTGRVRILKDLDMDVSGRDVVLVEDIVDTGLTVAYLMGELARRGPSSVEVCTLLDRAQRRIVPVPLRFVGFEIGDEHVVGYGLDHEERYRNLDRVIALGAASRSSSDRRAM